jgi:periplasmic protein TonB
MSGRYDILDEPERLRGPFLGSLVLHGGMFGLVVGMAVLHPFGGKVEHWGSKTGGGFGAVAVTAVKTIPLPSRTTVQNPVANDTESQVPAPQSKQKPQPKVVKPDPRAILLKSKNAKDRTPPPRQAAAAPNKWVDQQRYAPNQLTTPGGQMAGSPLYQVQGGGGIGIGDNNPFGTRFGSYANLLRQKVSGAWHVAEINPRLQTAPPVTVQFTIMKDGSLKPGLPRITQSSGDSTVDTSAQRAVLDAQPFPPLPTGFERNEAVVELTFVLRR